MHNTLELDTECVDRCSQTGMLRYGTCSLASGCIADPGVPDCRLVWRGEHDGLAECREYGFWAAPTSGGWTPAGPADPSAVEVLNRLIAEAVWDRADKRFRLRHESAPNLDSDR